jgi:hypothetical protein
MIYQGAPSPHLPGIARVMAEKLIAKKRCLYFNSPAMVAGIRSFLSAAGINVAAEVAKGSLILSSDQTHLIERRFDSKAMLTLLADAVDQARKDLYAGLWAAGDMTWEFGPEKNFDSLYEYEVGLEELFLNKPTLEGICMYHIDTLPPSALETALHTHRAVYINDTLSRVSQYYGQREGSGALRPVPVVESQRMLAQAKT